MPSALLGNPLASGPQLLFSGNPYSGGHPFPQGGVQVRLHPNASGNAYVGFSGNLTLTSGGFFLSGSLGYADGMILGPGDSYFVPKIACGISGQLSIFVLADAACSGQARIFFDVL
jgi:hypothetical protein